MRVRVRVRAHVVVRGFRRTLQREGEPGQQPLALGAVEGLGLL